MNKKTWPWWLLLIITLLFIFLYWMKEGDNSTIRPDQDQEQDTSSSERNSEVDSLIEVIETMDSTIVSLRKEKGLPRPQEHSSDSDLIANLRSDNNELSRKVAFLQDKLILKKGEKINMTFFPTCSDLSIDNLLSEYGKNQPNSNHQVGKYLNFWPADNVPLGEGNTYYEVDYCEEIRKGNEHILNRILINTLYLTDATVVIY